ncbi:MAG: response regulator [Gammaproteobacteria bacterium]|nr:response regulator [Gammaproteobacteria bacterium]
MIPCLNIETGSSSEVERLRKIVTALMAQVERSMDVQGGAFSLFQTAILLDDKVRDRTCELEAAKTSLEETNDELNRANAEAHTARLRLVEAVESVSEGFALFDKSDRLVLCNSRFCEYWGIGHNDIHYGASFADISKGLVDSCRVPGALKDRQGWLKERLQRHRNPDGAIVLRMFDGRWLKVTERLTGDGGIVGIYTDITEIKKQEKLRRQQELAEKSVLLQASIDNLSQGVAVYNKDLKLAAWNQQFVDLLDLPDGFVDTEMSFSDYLQFNNKRKEYSKDTKRSIKDRLDQAAVFTSFFFEYTRPNGTVLEVRRNPMPNGGFVTTYTDITARRQTAVQLREAKENLEMRVQERTSALSSLNEKLQMEIAERREVEEELLLAKALAEDANLSKTKFLAAASHDLLQPLNAARLFISILQEQPLVQETAHLVERTDMAMQGVENLLSTLLEISKLDAGAVPTEVIDFPVVEVMDRLAQEYRAIANDSGIELRMVPSSVTVRSDRKLLERLLRNFLSNAVRYTERGKILVGCRRKKNMIVIQVTDTGPGIDDRDLASIFEEFHQLNRSVRKGMRGVGLGLAIVKRIAGMLGARVRVSSKVGHGSTFMVEIPTSEQKLVPIQPVIGEVNGSQAMRLLLQNISVLVVDNEESIREGMAHLIESWGGVVCTAVCVNDALKAVEQGNKPDLVIVDYHLDNQSTGIEVLKQLNRQLGLHVPSLVITADRGDEVRKEVIDFGCGLLNKPLKPHRLRAWMAHSIETSCVPGAAS